MLFNMRYGFRDAKIAALEKSNQESERSFSQAKSDKLRQLEEIHNMSKKQVEFEARLVKWKVFVLWNFLGNCIIWQTVDALFVGQTETSFVRV